MTFALLPKAVSQALPWLKPLLEKMTSGTSGEPDPIVQGNLLSQDDKVVGSAHRRLSDIYNIPVYVDEEGTTWTPPTAWAYAMVCKVRLKLAVRLMELETELKELRGESSHDTSSEGSSPRP